jgi:hypothetical protein
VNIDPAWIVTAAVAPLVGVVVFNITAVVKAWLIPRWTYNLHIELLNNQRTQEVKLLNEEVARLSGERDEWRSAAHAMEVVNQEVRAQNRLLLEGQRTSVYAWEQIRRTAAGEASEGGNDE